MFEKLIIKLSGIDCSKKNPINYDKLLRYPGQSLDEELDSIKDKLIEKITYAAFLLMGLVILVIT